MNTSIEKGMDWEREKVKGDLLYKKERHDAAKDGVKCSTHVYDDEGEILQRLVKYYVEKKGKDA